MKSRTMPDLLRWLVILGIIVPLLTFWSVLTGDIGLPERLHGEYGAARSLLELLLVLAACLPAAVGAFLMLARVAGGRVVFLLGLAMAWFAPLLLELVRASLADLMSVYVVAGMVMVAATSGYLFSSRAVRHYCSSQRRDYGETGQP